MSISHIVTLAWTRQGEQLTQNVTLTADTEVNGDIAVPATTTDLEAIVAFDKTKVKSVFVHSDQDVTVETNSGSAPGNTITLTANTPLVWFPAMPLANPFTVDVTKFYITNAGASAAVVKYRILVDGTP